MEITVQGTVTNIDKFERIHLVYPSVYNPTYKIKKGREVLDCPIKNKLLSLKERYPGKNPLSAQGYYMKAAPKLTIRKQSDIISKNIDDQIKTYPLEEIKCQNIKAHVQVRKYNYKGLEGWTLICKNIVIL